MCKYCQNLYGEYDYEALLSVKVDLGAAGKLLADLAITGGNDPMLELDGGMSTSSNNCVKETQKIRYCPMCGDDLKARKPQG